MTSPPLTFLSSFIAANTLANCGLAKRTEVGRPAWANSLSMRSTSAWASPSTSREIFAAAPLDRILVETDSPYLAPPPHRGKRNEPAYTAHTARKGAETFGMDYADFAAATQANFDRLFAKAAAWPDRKAA